MRAFIKINIIQKKLAQVVQKLQPFSKMTTSAHMANVKFGFATVLKQMEENCLEQQIFEIIGTF